MADDQIRKWVQLKLENGIEPDRIRDALKDMDKDPNLVEKVQNDELAEHPSIDSNENNTQEEDETPKAAESIIDRNKPEEIDEIEEMPHDIELSTSPMADVDQMTDPFNSAVENEKSEESDESEERKERKSREVRDSGSEEDTRVIDIPGVDEFELTDSQLKIGFSLINTLIVGLIIYYVFVSG